MNNILEYVKPDLVVVSIVLYLLGVAMKQSEAISDKYIPLLLGIFGVFAAALYVFATSEMQTVQDVLLAVFTSFVQGVLVAGLSTYVNQLFKQLKKNDENEEEKDDE